MFMVNFNKLKTAFYLIADMFFLNTENLHYIHVFLHLIIY